MMPPVPLRMFCLLSQELLSKDRDYVHICREQQLYSMINIWTCVHRAGVDSHDARAGLQRSCTAEARTNRR